MKSTTANRSPCNPFNGPLLLMATILAADQYHLLGTSTGHDPRTRDRYDLALGGRLLGTSPVVGKSAPGNCSIGFVTRSPTGIGRRSRVGVDCSRARRPVHTLRLITNERRTQIVSVVLAPPQLYSGSLGSAANRD